MFHVIWGSAMINTFAEIAVRFCSFFWQSYKITKTDSNFCKIVYHCTTSYNMEHYTMKFVPLTFLEIDIRSLKDLASFKVHMSISRHVRDMKFLLKYSLYPYVGQWLTNIVIDVVSFCNFAKTSKFLVLPLEWSGLSLI